MTAPHIRNANNFYVKGSFPQENLFLSPFPEGNEAERGFDKLVASPEGLAFL